MGAGSWPRWTRLFAAVSFEFTAAFAWMVIARYRLEVLRHSGEDKALAYFEWSAPDDAKLDDQQAWAMARFGQKYGWPDQHGCSGGY